MRIMREMTEMQVETEQRPQGTLRLIEVTLAIATYKEVI